MPGIVASAPSETETLNQAPSPSQANSAPIVLAQDDKKNETQNSGLDFNSFDEKSRESIISLASDAVKKDFLVMFGIFASLITFVSVQIQIFSKIDGVLNLLGISCVTLAGLLLFAVTLANLSRKNFSWRDYLNPAVVLCLLFLIAGFLLIVLADPVNANRHDEVYKQHDYLNTGR